MADNTKGQPQERRQKTGHQTGHETSLGELTSIGHEKSLGELTSINEYGRKTWNKQTFAERAEANPFNKTAQRVSGLASVTSYSSQDFAKQINKVQLVDASLLTSVHRGKSSGFYCSVCNLTFKDNLSYLNHTNTSYHLQKMRTVLPTTDNVSDKSKTISVAQIRQKLKQMYDSKLKDLQAKDDLQYYNLKKRIQKRVEFEEKQKILKLQRKKQRSDAKQKAKILIKASTDQDPLLQLMGFSGFSKSKNK